MNHLAGSVERVTFHNPDNGFCVLRVKVKGERELVMLIGHKPMGTPGKYASASGMEAILQVELRRARAVEPAARPAIADTA